MKSSKFCVITVLSLFLALAASGCSKDKSVIAVFGEGKDLHKVTVGDVKQFFLRYSDRLMFITNEDMQKNIIFQRYMAQDMVYLEQVKNGYTNTEEYWESYSNECNRHEIVILSQKGHEAFKNASLTDSTEKFDVVHPAHILLTANRSTNIEQVKVDYITTNGSRRAVTNRMTIQTNLSDKEYAKFLKSREGEAASIIDDLKKSSDIEKDFNRIASNRSQDPSSARNGGDDGLIPRSYLPRELEEAAFSATNRGLMDKPVPSGSGYYVILIKEAPAQITISEIEKEAGKTNFGKIEQNLINLYNERMKSENLKLYYTTNSKTVTIEGRAYAAADIPDSAVISSMWDNPLTWKDIKVVLSLFSTNKINSINDFLSAMNIMNNTYFDYRNAVRLGLENDPKITNDMAKFRENAPKFISVRAYFTEKTRELNSQMEAADTPAAEKDYYESHKEQFLKSVSNKIVQIPLKDASGNIKEMLKREFMQNFYNKWKDEMMTESKLSFKESGMRDLKAIEMDQYRKFAAKMKLPLPK